jgi:hypothetical protein
MIRLTPMLTEAKVKNLYWNVIPRQIWIKKPLMNR